MAGFAEYANHGQGVQIRIAAPHSPRGQLRSRRAPNTPRGLLETLDVLVITEGAFLEYLLCVSRNLAQSVLILTPQKGREDNLMGYCFCWSLQ